jgi:glycosyltransferase involved in cell wall biosynthesis
MRKKAVVSVSNDLYTDQRVHKVCLFLQEQGYDILLVGRLRPNSIPLTDRPYLTHRLRMYYDKGPAFYAWFSIRLFLFLLFHKADLLVSNDLDTLLPNFLASKFKRKVRLVYDTHEYFTEVPELVARPKIKAIWEKIEGWIFPKLTQVYTVNNSISQKYTQKYGLPVSVVRNISPRWENDNLKSRSALGLPEDCQILIFQGAGINVDRGAEEAVLAMPYVENALLLFVGDGDVVQALKQLVQENQLEAKVRFLGKMPYAELMNYTWHADLGLTLDKDTNLNYRFSLPNKVFDYMHTQTPILASSVIEVKTLVEKYNIGQIIRSHEPIVLAEDIRNALHDENQLQAWKNNCLIASAAENWEAEKKVLRTIYPAVL